MFVRITRAWKDVSEFIMGLKCSRIAVYEHEADDEVNRTHIHFYIEDFVHTIEGFKKSLKRHLNTDSFNKADWSFCEKQKSSGLAVNADVIIYMSKGTLDPVYQKGFTQETLESYKSQWVERPRSSSKQARLQIVTKESASEAKKRKNDLVVEMIAQLGGYIQADENCMRMSYNEYIIRSIINVLNDNKLVFGRYTIRDYYDTICCRTKPDNFSKLMETFCLYKA